MKHCGQHGIQFVFVFLSSGCFEGEYAGRAQCGIASLCMRWRLAGK
jgi:hypothetical protein